MTTDEIKQSVSMRELVERYGIHIDRKGFCCCPFHKEKTGSMKIYKDSYNCFGCGANGDIFSFVMGMENCDFKTAYKALGGSYRQQSDHQRNLYHYHLQKRKEDEIKRLQRAEQEKKEVTEEIRMQKLFKKLSPVFSDDWCEAVNRLEYLFYKLEYLTEKR
ncbi:MAG: DNA primase [Lachnospiraceae bacterium]|nr:DNA primase [Lachnospiraceae bacterium]